MDTLGRECPRVPTQRGCDERSSAANPSLWDASGPGDRALATPRLSILVAWTQRSAITGHLRLQEVSHRVPIAPSPE
jgi:hypothetical protein